MTDNEILEKIKSRIPHFMETDPDACLMQSFFCGYAEGVREERERFKEVLEESIAATLAKIIATGKEIE